MLTRERLKKKVLKWWQDCSLTLITDGQINTLAKSLEDEVVEIAKEAYQRGLKGDEF